MGSSASNPIATTHDEALSNTENTRMIMDQLFNYMIKQLGVRDLLRMSKESECKKYILFKANSIYKYFYELRIFPTKDSKGFLTFRRTEDLIKPKGEQEKERQSLCLIVAYFYTRIFQIYGALALTLIDDKNAMISSGIMSTFPKGTNARVMTPGRMAQPVQSYYGRGGAIRLLDSTKYPPPTTQLKNFDWIRSFLTSNSQSSNKYSTRYDGTGEHAGTVNIEIEDHLLDNSKTAGGKIIYISPPPPRTYQYATFPIWIAKQWATLDCYTRIDNREIKVKLGKLTFINAEKKKITVSEFEPIDFIIERISANGKQIYIVKDKPITDVPAFMADLLSKVIIYLRSAINEEKDDSYDRDYSDRARDYYSDRDRDYSDRSRAYSNRDYSEEGITSHLKIEKMIKNITVHKPLGHCIARALQLLKTDPLANEQGISQICSVAFDAKKTDRIGLPKGDKALSEHPGLFALASLFYDTISIGSPNLTIGTDPVSGRSTFQDYVAFMTILSNQYKIDDNPLTQDDYKTKGLSGIVNTRDKKVCDSIGLTTDETTLSPETTSQVHNIVKSMFQDQVTHAAKCYEIISMLFTITKDPATKKPIMFKLNDNLISNGFPELDRINRATRKILVEYYTNCENKYIAGMKLIWTEKEGKVREGSDRAKAALAEEQAAKAALAAEADAKTKAEAKIKEEAEARTEARRLQQIQAQLPKSQAESRQLMAARAQRKGKPPVAGRPRVVNSTLKRYSTLRK